jgi:hypothetical protein
MKREEELEAYWERHRERKREEAEKQAEERSRFRPTGGAELQKALWRLEARLPPKPRLPHPQRPISSVKMITLGEFYASRRLPW